MCAVSMFKKSCKYVLVMIALFLMSFICMTISFADITVINQPTSIVVNNTEDELKLILDFNLSDGDIQIDSPESVSVFGQTLPSVGTWDTVNHRLILTINDPSLIADILQGADPIDITFPANALSNGLSGPDLEKNTSEIRVDFITPVHGKAFNVSDTNEFKATASLVTSGAGTQVMTFFNKADFELDYPTLNQYYNIVPTDVAQGQLTFTGDDIKQFSDTVTISGSSLSHDFSGIHGLDDNKPYTGIYFTASPAGGGSDQGAYLFFSGTSVAEGVRNDGDPIDRPEFPLYKHFSSYRLNEARSGYNVYFIINFENEIESNMIDHDGNDFLPLGIDFKSYGGDDYVNMLAAKDFDAIISGKQLIIMMDDSKLPNTEPYFEIARGTLKDPSTGKANIMPLTIGAPIMLDTTPSPTQFTHGAIEWESQSVEIGSNAANVRMDLLENGLVYNSYVPVDDFDMSYIKSYNSHVASALPDNDFNILEKNKTEFVSVSSQTGPFEMATTLSNLAPETDYYWITTVALESALLDDMIIEGYIEKFTTKPHTPGVEITALTYHANNNEPVTRDDFVMITFSEDMMDFGENEDYKFSIDTDNNGSYEQVLTDEDFTIQHGQFPPNQVKLLFDGNTATLLENCYNAKLKVEIKNLLALEPDISSSNNYRTVAIPNRSTDLASATLTVPNTDISIPVFDIEKGKTVYSIPVLPSVHNNFVGEQITLVGKDPSVVYSLSDASTGFMLFTGTHPITKATADYEFNYEADGFLFEDITVNGNSVTGYYPNKYSYDIILPAGTTSQPIVEGVFDTLAPASATTTLSSTGDLSNGLSIALSSIDADDPRHIYTLNFTVTPTEDNGTDDSDSSNSSSSSSKDKNKKSDSSVTNTISQNTGSLVDAINNPTPTPGTQETGTATENIIDLMTAIKTPAGARIVLDKMPETLEELLEMKAGLASLDDSLKMDADIAKLIAETERLIALLNQSKKSQQHVKNIIDPLSDYYNSMESRSLVANQVLIGSVDMTNAAIAQAGTLHLNWSNVEIEGGRVYLSPSPRDITQAIRAANQMETSMENILGQSLTPGLNSGIITTITYDIPTTLENAAQTGVVLDQETINTLTANNVGQIDLNMGPVTFGMDDTFLNNFTGTNLEFNVSNQGSMNEEESNGIPTGSSAIGAPVLDLTSFQNSALDEAFNRPIVIAFNLDYFNFTPIDGERLYIGKWNSDLNAWEAVGGAYDNATNTISTNRTHLSKYTVLKSEKTYSTLEDSWAKNEIASLKNKGIIEEESLFTGNENITREEFACWVSKAYGLDATTYTEDGLGIDPESEYYQDIEKLYSDAALMSGTAGNQLDTSSDLSKEELAVLIASALDNYDRTIDTNTFELAQYEEDIPTWAVGSVETVVENGLVDESFFGSAEAVTKEEAANILYQVYN